MVNISKACHYNKSASDQKSTVFELFNISDRKCEPPAIKLDVMMNNTKIIVEVDTGASVTLINESRSTRSGLNRNQTFLKQIC